MRRAKKQTSAHHASDAYKTSATHPPIHKSARASEQASGATIKPTNQANKHINIKTQPNEHGPINQSIKQTSKQTRTHQDTIYETCCEHTYKQKNIQTNKQAHKQHNEFALTKTNKHSNKQPSPELQANKHQPNKHIKHTSEQTHKQRHPNTSSNPTDQTNT